ncbi:hypothetical protein KY332_00505 [Candidatus Woesearchaeota archaeon]|nr:hypothetical protein [Candidatus Woesearchaeota archaeon]
MPEITEEAHKKRLDLGGLFGGKKKEEAAGVDVSGMIMQVNELARRLRILESRFTDLNRKEQVTEKNMLTERKRFTSELKTMDSDILDLKKEINEIRTKMDMVVGELRNLAAKEDIEAIKKYVELWEPVNFVTRAEVEKIVKEAIQEKGK